MMTPRRWRTAALAGLGTVLAGCASNAPQDTWAPEGPNAQDIDNLQRPVFYIAGVVGLLVFAAVVYSVLKFRDRPGRAMPHQSHGNKVIEIGLASVSALILAVLAVPTTALVLDLAEKPDCNYTVQVVGQQWWWEFSYDNGAVTANEIVIPTGEPVCLRITSRDVIHSFWIPKLNGKKDAVPGRIHDWKIEADKPGDYWGQCAEFCGLSHANMRIRARALAPADFEAWYANEASDALQPTDALALQGQTIFSQQCTGCHFIDGLTTTDAEGTVTPFEYTGENPLVAGAAPNLTHFAARSVFAGATWETYIDDPATPEDDSDPYTDDDPVLNRTQLEAWLRDPPGELPQAPNEGRGMPNLNLSEEQIDALVAYLSGLK